MFKSVEESATADDHDFDLLELPATELGFTYLPKFDSNGFGIQSMEASHSFLVGYDDLPPLEVTPGIAVHGWSGPELLDLPPRVYDVYVDLMWQYWISHRSAILIGATPGLYGVMEHVDRQTFQWSGWLLARRDISEKWSAVAGVTYLRQLNSNWLPLGGLIWTPDERTRIDILFPCPRVSRSWWTSGTWSHGGFVSGEIGGGAWSVQDTLQSNVLVGYSDLRLNAGWESESTSGRQCSLQIGYVFARDIYVNDVRVFQPSDSVSIELLYSF